MIILYVALIVLLFNVWTLLQIFARHWVFHGRLYRPHLLNLALSWLPNIVLGVYLLVTSVVVLVAHAAWPAIITTVCFIPVWLLLLPNANYLITELNLNHRSAHDEPVPLWYDIISVLSLTLTGVLNAVSSIVVINATYVLVFYEHAAQLLRNIVHDPWFWVITAGSILLSSFGIYMGRYLRVNSWDAKHPLKLFAKVKRHLASENHVREAALYTLFFSVFLFLIYLLFTAPAVALLMTLTG